MKQKGKKSFAVLVALALLLVPALSTHAQEASGGPEALAGAFKPVGNEMTGYFMVPDDWEVETDGEYVLCLAPGEDIMICAAGEKGGLYGGATAENLEAGSFMMRELLMEQGCSDIQCEKVSYQGHEAIACISTLEREGECARIGFILYFTEEKCVMIGAGGVSESDFVTALHVMNTFQPAE